jgi:hypothetical protein
VLLLLPALLLLLGSTPTALAAGCPTQRVGYKEALAVLAANECEKLIVGGPQLSAAEAGALGALLGTNTALQELTIGNDRQDAADLFPQMGTAFLEDTPNQVFYNTYAYALIQRWMEKTTGPSAMARLRHRQPGRSSERVVSVSVR